MGPVSTCKMLFLGKYQPSGARGTRSLPEHHTAFKIQDGRQVAPKWPTWCGKGFNPVRADVSESLVWPGGGAQRPPLEIHEGVVWDPLLLFRSYTSIKIEITWGISGRNLKNWVRFHDLKIWRNRDFALGWLTKMPVTRSIFEIRDSSFGFFLLFMFVRNHI